jgi:hypothetical protein
MDETHGSVSDDKADRAAAAYAHLSTTVSDKDDGNMTSLTHTQQDKRCKSEYNMLCTINSYDFD